MPETRRVTHKSLVARLPEPQRSVTKWVEKNGGTAVVVGSIGIMREGKYKHSVVFRFVGNPPTAKRTK